jgi:parvulin-like peptidyl-prolyl isomerase
MNRRVQPVPEALFLAASLLLTACGLGPDEAQDSSPVATVDDLAVSLDELESHLSLTLGEGAAEADDEVRSRLLDSLLIERLIALDAEEAGFAVSDIELEDRLAELEVDQDGTAGGGQALDAAFLDRLRRSVLVDRFLAERVVGVVEVSEEEIQEGAQQGDAPGGDGPLVVYRQAMTESLEDAREILRRVRGGKEPFASVAAQLSLSPEGAEPQWALLGQLPPEVRKALLGGPRGEVVGPVSVGCGGESGEEGCVYYVFLIENREDRPTAAARTTEDIREEIRRAKQDARLESYREGLLRSGRIVVHEENLPFRYVSPEDAQEESS